MDSKIQTRYKNPEFVEFFVSLTDNNPIEFQDNFDLVDEYIGNLKDLYSKYFRHFYSDINMYFFEMKYEDREYFEENLIILNRRLITLANEEKMEVKDSDKLRNNIIKIIDHINSIEYNDGNVDKRIMKAISETMNNYYDAITESINNNLLTIKGDTQNSFQEIENISAEITNTGEKLDDIDERVRSINIDIIAVLSIFSAIIISFFGGLNFIGQALASMNNGNPKLTIIIITISGIVMFNVIYFLFLLIGKVIRVPIGFECKKKYCRDCTEDCGMLKSIWKRHFMFVAVNIFLLIVIITIWLKLPGMFVDRVYIK